MMLSMTTNRKEVHTMDSLLTTRPSIQARLASNRRWRQVQIELDNEFGTEGVEAAMRAAGADPDAYLAGRKTRAACDPYFCGQCAEEAYR